MQCVLVGNYGVGNIGDEALREYFVGAFPEVEWVTVSGKWKAESGKYASVPRLPLGFRSFFAPWWKTLSAIRHADAVVFGGGSLFTDIESPRACMMWWLYAAAARFFWCPYHLAFQGAGPFRTFAGWRFARSAFENASSVSVRDEESLERVRQWKLPRPPVLSFDPAFALFRRDGKRKEGSETLLLIPRANSGSSFLAAAAKAVASSDRVRILLLEPDREQGIASKLSAIAPSADIVEIRFVKQFLNVLADASHVVTQRFHGALAALALGIPVEIIPQVSGDKLDALRAMAAHQSPWNERIADGEAALRSALTRHL